MDYWKFATLLVFANVVFQVLSQTPGPQTPCYPGAGHTQCEAGYEYSDLLLTCVKFSDTEVLASEIKTICDKNTGILITSKERNDLVDQFLKSLSSPKSSIFLDFRLVGSSDPPLLTWGGVIVMTPTSYVNFSNLESENFGINCPVKVTGGVWEFVNCTDKSFVLCEQTLKTKPVLKSGSLSGVTEPGTVITITCEGTPAPKIIFESPSNTTVITKDHPEATLTVAHQRFPEGRCQNTTTVTYQKNITEDDGDTTVTCATYYAGGPTCPPPKDYCVVVGTIRLPGSDDPNNKPLPGDNQLILIVAVGGFGLLLMVLLIVVSVLSKSKKRESGPESVKEAEVAAEAPPVEEAKPEDAPEGEKTVTEGEQDAEAKTDVTEQRTSGASEGKKSTEVAPA